MKAMMNRWYLGFLLIALMFLGAAQGSTTKAADQLAIPGARLSTTSAQQEQTPADDALPPAPNQLYLPLLRNGAGDAVWSDVAESLLSAQRERQIIPQKYRTVLLNATALQQLLQATPMEGDATAQRAQVLFSLPLPDGAFGRFRIVEAPIMAPELAAKFPEIKTYAGQGIDDPTATVRFDWTPAGFHAQILAAGGAVYIDPYSRNDTLNYISYYKRDYQPPAGSGIKEPPQPNTDPARLQELQALVEQYQASRVQAAAAVGTQLRTYRLAMASNGEYTQLVGGTAAAMAAIATTVNRVTGIYETEVAIRFVLVANNDLLIYTDPDTDPYTNNDTVAMLTENQTTLDSVIGNGSYDIGHLLHTGPGGVAYTPAVCDNSLKAGGNSGNGTDSVGDPFIVDFVAHEIGHQFSAGHIFNDSGPCGPNRGAATAYEPGSGSTIMSYAGVCLSSDLQPHNDPLFNSASFEQIVAFSTLGDGNSCPVITNTGNSAPVVNAGVGGFTIPRQTPFTLTGSAADADGDALTYSWEEHDLGDADGSLANNPLEAPFFRSFPPVTSPLRTFPQWSDIVNNTSTIGEILPNVTRALNFRLTARDNRSGGSGVDYASTTINVTTAAGPFLVTAPNTAVTWTGNTTQNVTWDVANTNVAPVSCTSVRILLSTDGGFTYPTALAIVVPNNGSATVTVPNIATTTARVQVVCANNIFFDISNTDFTITESTPESADVAVTKTDASDPVVQGNNITYNIVVSNNGPDTANTVTLVDTLPAGVSFVSATPGSCSHAAGTVTCNLGNLTSGSSTNVTIVVSTSGSTPASVSNTASVTSSTSDPNNANNSDSETTTVNPPTPASADVAVTKTDASDPVVQGNNITYNIVVSNNGPDTASTVTLVDTLPAGVGFVSATPSQGTCTGTGPVTCNLGSLTNGASATITIVVSTSGSTPASVTNTASVSAVTSDPNNANNSDSETTTVNPPTGSTVSIMISSDENGKVPGLSFRDEDIMAYNSDTGLWSMVFDGSDVGLGNVDVDAFAFLPNGHLLLSVDKDFTLNGFGPVDESDILEFIPGSYGPATSGSYLLYFDGSDVDLDKSDEDVDAIDFDASGNLLISVNGSFKAQGVKGADEDLFKLSSFTPGANTTGTWSLYFDGSDVGLTKSGEDLFGLWVDHANSKLYLTTHDNFSVPGASGDEDDIFVCQYSSLGATTACTFTVFWNGDLVGFDDDAIDGLSIGDPLVDNGCVTTANASTSSQELSPDCLVETESQSSVAIDDTVEYTGDDANEPDPLDGEEMDNTIFLPLIKQ